jgi:hypothetical protein
MTGDRIGLLFVHGIGEQKRWEHLHSSVLELAELLRRSDDVAGVSVIDRTQGWSAPAGEPDFKQAPLSMDVRMADGRAVRYECHEVWWADLGCRAGPVDTINFWLWGLGQWCAPIYRDMDASGLSSRPPEIRGPLSALPRSVVGRPLEIWARVQLFLAALTAAFVLCTWSLAKRVFATVLRQSPSPTLIVQYVGDVRTYTERAAPGDSPLSDPGFPRRVGIRRRMVREMVALAGNKEVKEWYVLAHSLGTIVAYNGLTEIGHALPNYLTEEQWKEVPPDWKRDEATGRRTPEDIGRMMPARPPWLADEDVINRQLLFGKLRGFLTYGSPLDKFAGLWPRIVATATDHDKPFPDDFRWVNLHAPTDPVAGSIDCYDEFQRMVPKAINCRARWSPWAGIEHIWYFKGFERHRRAKEKQRIAIGEWLLGGDAGKIDQRSEGSGAARLFAGLWYILLICVLWAVTTAIVVLARRAWAQVGGGTKQTFFDWSALWIGLREHLGPVAGIAIGLILAVGMIRWMRESWLNWRLGRADSLPGPVVTMLIGNAVAATLLTAVTVPLILIGLSHDFELAGQWLRWAPEGWIAQLIRAGWMTAILSLVGIVLASSAQAFLNASDAYLARRKTGPRLRR